MINMLAPIHSQHHEMINTVTITKVGINCMTRAARMFQIPVCSLNTSKANILVNSANRIHKTLGDQNRIHFVFPFMIDTPLVCQLNVKGISWPVGVDCLSL